MKHSILLFVCMIIPIIIFSITAFLNDLKKLIFFSVCWSAQFYIEAKYVEAKYKLAKFKEVINTFELSQNLFNKITFYKIFIYYITM